MTRGARVVVAEACRNVLSRPWLFVTYGLLVVAAGVTVSVAEGNAIADSYYYGRRLDIAGANTLLVEPAPGVDVDVPLADCLALSSAHGVRAVGATSEPVVGVLWTPNGPRISVRYIVGPLLREWSVLLGSEQIVAVRNTRSTSGSPRTIIHLPDQRIETALQGRDLRPLGPGFANTVFIARAPDIEPAACIVRVDPDERETARTTIAVLFPESRGFAQRWASGSGPLLETGRERFEQRPTQHLWLGGCAVITLVGALVVRLRRPDHALYAAVSISRPATRVLAALELGLVWCVAGALWAITHLALVTTSDLPTSASQGGIVAGARCLLVSLVLLCACAATAAPRSLIESLKDR